MASSPSVAICVMGGLCIVNASYSAVKERKIAAIPSLRAANEKLKKNAKGLEVAVEALTKEVDQLRPEATRAAIVEEELGSIASAQEVNVDRLMELVRENSDILSKMRDNLRQRIVQVIISIVVKSDKDNNQTISHTEAKTLALHIRIALQEYDVLFDTDKFLRAIGGDTTVAAIIAIVQRLLPGEPGGGNGVEEEGGNSEDDMYDMFHMVDEGSTTAKGVSLMTCDRKKSAAKERAAPDATDQYPAVMEEKRDSTYESFPESEAGSDEASSPSDPYEL